MVAFIATERACRECGVSKNAHASTLWLTWGPGESALSAFQCWRGERCGESATETDDVPPLATSHKKKH